MKVYIEKSNVQVGLRFLKNGDFIDFAYFEVGIGPILKYFATDVLIAIRDGRAGRFGT